jgi:hypothetical protein
VATLKFHDKANEFRIEIIGKFSGPCVQEAADAWQGALRGSLQRKITADISRMSGYDQRGRATLRDMHLHGTAIAGGTPLALVFLNEITDMRNPGPALVLQSETRRKQPQQSTPTPKSAAAGK